MPDFKKPVQQKIFLYIRMPLRHASLFSYPIGLYNINKLLYFISIEFVSFKICFIDRCAK